MQVMKEKAKNLASSAKEHMKIYKAKAEEKAAIAAAKTEGEKVVAHEVRKAKEAEAKRKLHEAKARHRMERANAQHARRMAATGGSNMYVSTHDHHGGHTLGSTIPVVAAKAAPSSMTAKEPTNPMGGYPSGGSKYL
ncbi:late embryogenesis abundant protein 6-like [Aristolochia californica]|uniref:late embryogenesis abundant protein 6-like n=1 Tax=Aristolochia californica TaxID=171875 RepID=UPI0035D5F15B